MDANAMNLTDDYIPENNDHFEEELVVENHDNASDM